MSSYKEQIDKTHIPTHIAIIMEMGDGQSKEGRNAPSVIRLVPRQYML